MPPKELGVKQVDSKVSIVKKEFVYCDPNGGAWACNQITKKTPFNKIDDADMVDTLAKSAIANLATDPQSTLISTNSESPKISNLLPSTHVKPFRLKEEKIPSHKPLKIITFDFDSSKITPQEKITLLEILPTIKGKHLEIHGFTDNVGGEDYNHNLGQQRANEVANFFAQAGEDETFIKTHGHGLCCYRNDNNTDEHRSENRRVEIYLVD